jgi:hypothetical protein
LPTQYSFRPRHARRDRLPEIYLPNEQPKTLGLMINLSAAKSLTA